MAEAIRSFFLNGPAGRLEALFNAGTNDAKCAALVTHPHPLFGGTMHNKVVYHAAKALNSFGFPVLRFNFRGAGLSEGEHDNGFDGAMVAACRAAASTYTSSRAPPSSGRRWSS